MKLGNGRHCEERERRSNLLRKQRLLRGVYPEHPSTSLRAVYPELGEGLRMSGCEGLAMTAWLNFTALS
jgi:hypothetical protein